MIDLDHEARRLATIDLHDVYRELSEHEALASLCVTTIRTRTKPADSNTLETK